MAQSLYYWSLYIFLPITYSTLRNIQSVEFVISKLCNKNDVSQTVGNIADNKKHFLAHFLL